MNQAVAAWEDFDKGTEILEGNDSAFVGLADFNIPSQTGDEFLCTSHGRPCIGVNADCTIILNIHLSTRFGANAFDRFPARSDQKPNFILRDFEHFDLRCVLGEFRAVSGQDGAHEFEDVVTSLGGAVDSILQHGKGKAREFEVQLEAGHTLCGAAQFKVHVAEVIFASDDVGEHLVAEHFRACSVEFGDESDANACNGRF